MAYEDRIMRMAANAAARRRNENPTLRTHPLAASAAARRRNEGIANPHIRERRLRSLRTPSEQTIGPVGRGPLSVAEAAYHKGNVGTSGGDPFQGSLTKTQLAGRMLKDLGSTNVNDLYNQWLASQQGVLPYYFNQPPEGSPEFSPVGVTGRPTMPPEMYESIGGGTLGGGWRIGENPAFGQKQWNPDDIEGQTWGVDYTSEPEMPRWGKFLADLIGRNRGGLASLRYAR